ncbi:hypothetical protein IT575_13710 [bacterium]|nr:hypothetical protein [bacterium]
MARQSILQTDLFAELLPALREWSSAAAGLRDNALYQLLSRSAGRRQAAARRNIPLQLGSYGLGFAMVLGLSYFLLPRFVYVPFDIRLPLALLIAAVMLVSFWMSTGLYDTAIYALRLLSKPGSLGAGELILDESMLSARLDEREFVCALVAVCVPRLWLRWAFAAPVFLSLYALFLVVINLVESSARLGWMAQLPYSYEPLQVLKLMPLSLLVLYSVGFLSSILMLLFLIALGRSIAQFWQAQMVAASVAAVQLLYIPLGFAAFFNWYDYMTTAYADLATLGAAIAPFGPLAWYAAVMHFARPRPLLRIFLAALPPPAGIVLWWLMILNLGGGISDSSLRNLGNTMGWYFSSAALMNPLALPYGPCLGVSAKVAGAFCSMQWYRLPLLLLMLAALAGICATAARHAVYDWRHAED